MLSLVGKLSLLFGFGRAGRAGGGCELSFKLPTPLNKCNILYLEETFQAPAPQSYIF